MNEARFHQKVISSTNPLSRVNELHIHMSTFHYTHSTKPRNSESSYLRNSVPRSTHYGSTYPRIPKLQKNPKTNLAWLNYAPSRVATAHTNGGLGEEPPAPPARWARVSSIKAARQRPRGTCSAVVSFGLFTTSVRSCLLQLYTASRTITSRIPQNPTRTGSTMSGTRD